MTAFTGELVGTALVIILGDGVVANVILNKTNGFNSGWLVITMGWGMAVFTGVFVSAASSGAHLNPAVTIALAAAGKFNWSLVLAYIAAQMLGAMIGSLLVWVAYKQHFDATDNTATKLAVFCTSPSIRNVRHNLVTEIIGTFAFILAVLFIVSPADKLGSLDALPVALLVLGIGLGMGGPTGYAINPARDLGPRIMHAVLPIKNKGISDWKYSWIPVAGPIIGGLLAALVFKLIG
ncbi:MIP/aquaporin family protein [Parafilimonas sp.]|uniref:MIP/aquaporin family protein n=1 Tax=Parafilimonas sp. TaxID=1969739 RepID=UPI0039E3B103